MQVAQLVEADLLDFDRYRRPVYRQSDGKSAGNLGRVLDGIGDTVYWAQDKANGNRGGISSKLLASKRA